MRPPRSEVTPCDGATPDSSADYLAQRLHHDPDAVTLARHLYERHGIALSVERERWIDDGDYRGTVHLAPGLPVGPDRKHLAWLLQAFDDLAQVFERADRHVRGNLAFVRKPAVIRFFRTLNTTTPSAFAINDVIAYNLRGELWTSLESVEETLIHELFHLSDAVHGGWSRRALLPTYRRIRKRCGKRSRCYDRYAPLETQVDGGIYYAFHPTSDEREYGAELAARYVREQRWRLGAMGRPADGVTFKCLAPENAKVWRLFADEFFAGLDLVPPC